MASAPAAVWSAQFTDACDTAAALRDARIEYLSLSPAPYDARLTVVDLGMLRLQTAIDHAHIARGVVDSGGFMILFGLGGIVPGVRVNGGGMMGSDAVVLAPGAEIHAVTTGRQDWATVFLNAAAFADLIDSEAWPPERGFMVRQGLIAHSAGLRDLSANLAHIACRKPDRLALGSVPQSVIETMGTALQRGLGNGSDAQGQGRALHRRVRLVAAAEELMDVAIGRPVYIQDLCAALGVAPRTLHSAFTAVYGMGVHRYLRVRRLNLVRCALRAGGGDAGLVKSIALDFGFWHLGRFAHHYRALFGERPCETLSASHRA